MQASFFFFSLEIPCQAYNWETIELAINNTILRKLKTIDGLSNILTQETTTHQGFSFFDKLTGKIRPYSASKNPKTKSFFRKAFPLQISLQGNETCWWRRDEQYEDKIILQDK